MIDGLPSERTTLCNEGLVALDGQGRAADPREVSQTSLAPAESATKNRPQAAKEGWMTND